VPVQRRRALRLSRPAVTAAPLGFCAARARPPSLWPPPDAASTRTGLATTCVRCAARCVRAAPRPPQAPLPWLTLVLRGLRRRAPADLLLRWPLRGGPLLDVAHRHDCHHPGAQRRLARPGCA
jgi:hypothetical protein